MSRQRRVVSTSRIAEKRWDCAANDQIFSLPLSADIQSFVRPHFLSQFSSEITSIYGICCVQVYDFETCPQSNPLLHSSPLSQDQSDNHVWLFYSILSLSSRIFSAIPSVPRHHWSFACGFDTFRDQGDADRTAVHERADVRRRDGGSIDFDFDHSSQKWVLAISFWFKSQVTNWVLFS